MTLTNTYNLLLVDDQSIFLDSMEALVERIPGIHVVGKATNGHEAVALTNQLAPDMVLMDINMPGMDGIEATKLILKAHPATKVLVLSMYGHKEFVMELLENGISAYLLKTTGKAELLQAFVTVAAGGRYVAKEIQDLIAQSARNKDRDGEATHGVLTKREVEVVKLIVQERTTQEIADTLFVSVGTVETHRRNIMHKLDVRNSAGLVKYAMERGWGM